MSETAVTQTGAGSASGDGDVTLALIGYALLFLSIFFAGMTGLVAAVIAYSQRTAVSPTLRRHYTAQIRIFWVAVALSLIAAVCGAIAATVSVGDLFSFGGRDGWDAWDGVSFSSGDVRIDPTVLTLLGATGLAALATVLWLLIAPLVGFIRLATQRAVSDTAA